MARSSLANSSSNLNLSRRKTQVLQEMIMVVNDMSKALNPKHPLPEPEDRAELSRKWSNLIVAFAKMLL